MAKKKWAQVVNALDCGLKSTGEGPQRLEEKYQTIILPYEKHIAKADQFKKTAQTDHRCCVCKREDKGLPLMACKHCGVLAHAECIQFSHKIMPAKEWLCLSCINARELEFEDGPNYTLAEFAGKAAQLRKSLLENVLANNPDVPHVSPASMSREETENVIEKLYWQLVNDIYTDVSVDYGADLSNHQAYGGFPPKGHGPWNLNEMPIVPASLFSHLKEGISGMTAPWAYVGMCLSTFCWHTEDHYTYSINYHHWGEAKTWYGIPASHSSAFEGAFKRQEPKLFQKYPDLLSHLSFTLCPDALNGILPVYALDQRPGEFVLTFPRAYHAGFNHGLNFNEAANFAPADWLSYGQECLSRYRKHAKPPVFSHHELLLLATTTKDLVLAEQLIPHVEEASVLEQEHRLKTLTFVPIFREPPRGSVVQCLLCNSFCYFSHVSCECTDNHAALCLDHAAGFRDCQVANHVLIKMVRRQKIERAVARLKEFVRVWSPWAKRYAELQARGFSLSDLDQLVMEASTLCPDHPLAASQLFTRVQKCRNWEERCQQILLAARKKIPTPFSFPDDIKALVDQYEELNFLSQHADELSALMRDVEHLRQASVALVDSPSATLEQACELQAEACAKGIEFPEIRSVEYLIKKLQWCQDVQDLLDTTAYSPESAEALLSLAPSQTCPKVATLVGSLNEFLKRCPPSTLALASSPQAPSVNREEHDRVLERVNRVLRQSNDAPFAERPPIAELDSLLNYFQCLNTNDALLGELDAGRLKVGAWRNFIYELLTDKNIVVTTTLEDHLSSLLNTAKKAVSMAEGSRSCTCFQEPTSDSVTCAVCGVIYHPACIKLTHNGHGFICYICSPDRPLPESRPRIDYGELDLILANVRELPFVPDEFHLLEETSACCLAITGRLSEPDLASLPLELLKDHFRLLEGLGIKLKPYETVWELIVRFSSPSPVESFSARSLFRSPFPSAEPRQPKRSAPAGSPLRSPGHLQPSKRIQFNVSNEYEAPRAATSELTGDAATRDPNLRTAAHLSVQFSREVQTNALTEASNSGMPKRTDHPSSNLFSIENMFLSKDTVPGANKAGKVIRFGLQATPHTPTEPALRRSPLQQDSQPSELGSQVQPLTPSPPNSQSSELLTTAEASSP